MHQECFQLIVGCRIDQFIDLPLDYISDFGNRQLQIIEDQRQRLTVKIPP